MNTGIEALGDGIANTLNGLGIVKVGGGVVLFGDPTAELHALGEDPHAGIIYHSIEMAVGDVGFFHINGNHIGGVLVKIHLQAGIVAGFRHDIHRERVGRESDSAVLGHHGGYELGAIGALVVNIEELSIHELLVGKGHQDRVAWCGLPLTAAIGDGDVISGYGRFAVGGVGTHGHGGHIRGHRQVAGHGQVLRIVVAHGVVARGRVFVPYVRTSARAYVTL